MAANKLVWDARMFELYGIREQDFSGAYDAWQAGLHPEDRARGDAAITAAIEGSRTLTLSSVSFGPTARCTISKLMLWCSVQPMAVPQE